MQPVWNFIVFPTNQRFILTKVQVGIIIINNDFSKVVFNKKMTILDSYIKGDISSG